MKDILWVQISKAQELIDDLKSYGLTIEVIYHSDIVEIRISA